MNKFYGIVASGILGLVFFPNPTFAEDEITPAQLKQCWELLSHANGDVTTKIIERSVEQNPSLKGPARVLEFKVPAAAPSDNFQATYWQSMMTMVQARQAETPETPKKPQPIREVKETLKVVDPLRKDIPELTPVEAGRKLMAEMVDDEYYKFVHLHMASMKMTLQHLPIALKVFAENDPAKLLQGILTSSEPMIDAVNAHVAEANLAPISQAQFFRSDLGELKSNPQITSYGSTFIPLGIYVDDENNGKDQTLAVLTSISRLMYNLQVQYLDSQEDEQFHMNLDSGKIAYIIKDSILDDYLIGFQKADETYFQLPLLQIHYINVDLNISHIGLQVGADYGRALEGRVYDPLMRIPQNLSGPASIEEATKILAQGKLDVEHDLRAMYSGGNPESIIRKIDSVKNLRGIQLRIAYRVFAQGNPKKLLAAISRQDQRLLETIRQGLPKGFPDFLRARFQFKSTFSSSINF